MTWADQTFVGNLYSKDGAVEERGRFRRIDEKVVPAKDIADSLPTLPSTPPPRRQRKVFDLPTTADASDIQRAIDQAAAWCFSGTLIVAFLLQAVPRRSDCHRCGVRTPRQHPHAIECSDNVNVRLEKIDLYASNCFGFLEYNCDGSTYYRCRIDRRPLETDSVDRGDPRLRSLDADAFHSKHAIKGPAYIECTTRFMGDDCINICGDYHMVMASQGRQLRVLPKHSMNIQPGDPVELVTYDGRRLPDTKVVSVQRDGRIVDQERGFLSRQRMNESLRTARGALNDAYTITLDRDVDMVQGSVICSANRIGNHFSVKGCTFGHNRSRGILIKASHGEVSGNDVECCRMSGILVTPEYWWLEAGSGTHLQITGNTLTDCGGIAICVQALAGDGTVAAAGVHQNIAIVGNIVRDCPQPGILVTSTDGLRLEDNRLDLHTASKDLPGFLREAGLKKARPVIEINCQRKGRGEAISCSP